MALLCSLQAPENDCGKVEGDKEVCHVFCCGVGDSIFCGFCFGAFRPALRIVWVRRIITILKSNLVGL